MCKCQHTKQTAAETSATPSSRQTKHMDKSVLASTKAYCSQLLSTAAGGLTGRCCNPGAGRSSCCCCCCCRLNNRPCGLLLLLLLLLPSAA